MHPDQNDDDFDAGDPEALYRSLMEQDPASTLPRFSLAKLCIGAGRAAEAIPLLRFCVERQADWALAWMLLGDALKAAGDAGAKDAYARCRALAVRQNHASMVEEAEEKLAE